VTRNLDAADFQAIWDVASEMAKARAASMDEAVRDAIQARRALYESLGDEDRFSPDEAPDAGDLRDRAQPGR